ncbi:carboxypeptidase-like regulatory domain-containing protein [Luteitalea sp.]
MRHTARLAIGGFVAVVLTMAVVTFVTWRRPEGVRVVTGAVLTADTNPQRQRPVAQARVTAIAGAVSASGTTDESGLFRLAMDPPVPPDQALTLTVEHPRFHPFDASNLVADQLHLVRLRPTAAPVERANDAEVTIANVRVRYTSKAEATLDIASAARTFEFPNTANVPCAGQPPCSPDGRWKATVGTFSLEAGPTRQFRHVRVSCLAGPCPFTRIMSDNFSRGGATIRGTVLNWSDSVTYLVEAEVAQHIVSDLVRHAYPVIFERFMNFTLPSGAQGPSIEAEVKGEGIIYPLGPQLRLSWATCRLDARTDGTRLYRCELKPGFAFQT